MELRHQSVALLLQTLKGVATVTMDIPSAIWDPAIAHEDHDLKELTRDFGASNPRNIVNPSAPVRLVCGLRFCM
jgi:hypothetical protein